MAPLLHLKFFERQLSQGCLLWWSSFVYCNIFERQLSPGCPLWWSSPCILFIVIFSNANSLRAVRFGGTPFCILFAEDFSSANSLLSYPVRWSPESAKTSGSVDVELRTESPG